MEIKVIVLPIILLMIISYLTARGVVATTEFDESEPSNTVTVTTAGEAPSRPPAAVRVDAADQNSLNVYWKQPANPGWNEGISGYYVGYKISSHDVPYTFESIESADAPYQQYHLIIANLKAFTRYSVGVQAFNKIGTGPISDTVSVCTTYDNSEQPPQYDVICNTLTSQSINVSWLAPPRSCTNGVIGFKIIYGPSELWHDGNLRETKTDNLSEITLYALQKYTNYTIQVVALSLTNDGTPSIAVRCQTEQDVESNSATGKSVGKPPHDLQVTNKSSRSVELLWGAPLDGTNYHMGYLIQYKEHGMTWGAQMAQVLYMSKKTEFVLSSLNPATVYNIRVLAKTKFDKSEPSNTITVTTVGEAPSQPPTAVRVDAADQNALNVHWKPPANPGWHEEISGYYVGYKISSHDVPYTFETLESLQEPYQQYHLIIANLKASTRYSVVVQAFNKIDTGPMSDTVSVCTTYDNSEQPPQYDVICNTLTSQSINVSWSAPPRSCTNEVIGFKIIYGPSELWHDGNLRETKTANLSEITLYALQKYTNYTIQVVALSSTIDGTPSIPIRCETEQDDKGAQ